MCSQQNICLIPKLMSVVIEICYVGTVLFENCSYSAYVEKLRID